MIPRYARKRVYIRMLIPGTEFVYGGYTYVLIAGPDDSGRVTVQKIGEVVRYYWPGDMPVDVSSGEKKMRRKT